MKLSIVLALLLFTVLLPAQAHTSEELEAWMVEWVVEADESLSPAHIAAYYDMVERHPYHFNPQTVTQPFTPRRVNWGGTVEEWRPLVAGHFAPEKVETALCLIHYESRGNPNADNPASTAAGLFQFLRSTWDNMVPLSVTGGSYSSGQVYQPEANVRSAAWLQNAAGWTQWSPWNAGKCRGL